MKQYSISLVSKTSPTQRRVVTTSPTLAALVKVVIVDALGFLLAWKPTLAICLGHLVTWCWPGMRRA